MELKPLHPLDPVVLPPSLGCSIGAGVEQTMQHGKEDGAFNRKLISLPKAQAHEQIMKSGGKEYGFTEEVLKGLLTEICPHQTESTALRLGDLLIVGVPGELICSLGLKIKEQLRRGGAKIPVIGGLANEWISYILSPDEYDQGGYEASVSFYGRGLGPVIVKGALAAAQPLAK